MTEQGLKDKTVKGTFWSALQFSIFSLLNFQFNLVPLQRLTPYAGRNYKKQFMEVAGNQCDK